MKDLSSLSGILPKCFKVALTTLSYLSYFCMGWVRHLHRYRYSCAIVAVQRVELPYAFTSMGNPSDSRQLSSMWPVSWNFFIEGGEASIVLLIFGT